MDLRDYLRILRRSWLLILVFLLLGIGVGAALTVLSTPQYASTTRLFVSTPVGTNDINALQGSQFSTDRVTSYADLITGNAIAAKVIEKLHLTESPAALSAQIRATAVTNTVILEVTVTDASPARAQRLSQTTAEVFSDYVPALEGTTPAGQTPIKATIVDSAPLPTVPVSPRPKLNLALGGLVGLFLGFGIAVLREVLDNTIKTTPLLEELTQAATLGTVHFDPLAPKRPLVSQIEPTSARVESFRVLRTNLQFLDVDKPSRLITITSPVPGEGKSTTAANLAISLAEAGQRTLLLETDLRRPKIARYLNLEPAVGLTTVLIGKAGLDDVIQPWGDDGLDVVASGAIPPNPAELLQSKAMETFLAGVRERYQVVIVDAPPLLPVTDAALVAVQTDGAILLVRFGKTTRDQATQAAHRLESVDAALLGTILNFVPTGSRFGYGYGYGYGYYGYAPTAAPLSRGDRRRAKRAARDQTAAKPTRRTVPAPQSDPSAAAAATPTATPRTNSTAPQRAADSADPPSSRPPRSAPSAAESRPAQPEWPTAADVPRPPWKAAPAPDAEGAANGTPPMDAPRPMPPRYRYDPPVREPQGEPRHRS